MKMLENLLYKTNIVIKDDLMYQKFQQKITLSRHFCSTDTNDRYYLKLNTIEDDEIINQGYLYFYLHPENLSSQFIGIAVNEDYRNSGVASILISSWIQFCLDNGYEDLMTYKKQRKPFLLYLLKKYFFVAEDISDYELFSKLVYICRMKDSDCKCLIFSSVQEEIRFRNSNIMRSDNYRIIDSTDEEIQILDSVLLSTPYLLKDNEKAYQKAIGTYNRYRK